MSGKLSLTVELNKNSFPVDGKQPAYILIQVMPTAATMSNVYKPINFSLVLDRSGSMNGQKLNDLKRAAKLAVAQMTPEDILSIIIFDDQLEVILPAQPVTDLEYINQKIDTIFERGGTAISLGMEAGLMELRKHVNSERINRMLLLTDGETYGDKERCHVLASEAGQEGIPITALGLGEQFNEKLFDAIAHASGGSSDFIPEGDPQVIQELFQYSVQTAHETVVQNCELILRLLPGVTARQIWRVVPVIDRLTQLSLAERDVQVSLGDLSKREGQTVLVELTLPARQAGVYRMAQVEINYKIAATGQVGEKVKEDVVMDITTDVKLSALINPNVMNVVERVTTHRLQTRAFKEATNGDIAGATRKLRASATRLLDIGELELADTALKEAENLEQKGKMSAGGTRKLRYETRKLTRKFEFE